MLMLHDAAGRMAQVLLLTLVLHWDFTAWQHETSFHVNLSCPANQAPAQDQHRQKLMLTSTSMLITTGSSSEPGSSSELALLCSKVFLHAVHHVTLIFLFNLNSFHLKVCCMRARAADSDPRGFGGQHQVAHRVPGAARTCTDLGPDLESWRDLLEVI